MENLGQVGCLSTLLPGGTGFFQHPFSAVLWANLAVCFPFPRKENNGVTMFRDEDIDGLAPVITPAACVVRVPPAGQGGIRLHRLLAQAYHRQLACSD